MRIDAHHHLWQPARGDYDWMPKDIAVLNRSYSPSDLAPILDENGIEGTVLVQAAATVHETEYMLGLADASPFIKGVVGWVDFENPTQINELTRLAQHPKFKGVRPMIQDIPDVDWMLRDHVQWAYQTLIDLDLTFDALGFAQHMPNFLMLANHYPDLRMVFDHCMKPQIREQQSGKDAFSDWAAGITALATQTQGVCKLSALVTEADAGWTPEDIAPFARHVLDSFGADRVMWGSDWPVSRLQSEYAVWLHMAQEFAAHLSVDEQAAVFGGTATAFYRL